MRILKFLTLNKVTADHISCTRSLIVIWLKEICSSDNITFSRSNKRAKFAVQETFHCTCVKRNFRTRLNLQTFWSAICFSMNFDTLSHTFTISRTSRYVNTLKRKLSKTTYISQKRHQTRTQLCESLVSLINLPSSVSFGIAENRFFLASDTRPYITSAISAKIADFCH